MSEQRLLLEKTYLLNNWGTYVKCGIVVTFQHQAELTEALTNFPSITIELFIEKTGLAVIKMTDPSVLDEFLSQPWLKQVDMTNLSL